MTDIFREVDEEVRAQKLAAAWKRYGTLLTITLLACVAAVGGWQFYRVQQEKAALDSSARFEAALALSRQGRAADGAIIADKTADAEKAFAALGAGDTTAGYKLLSRFRAAAEHGQTDAAAGAAAFDAIADDGAIDGTLRDLARIRAATLLVDSLSSDDLNKRIGGLAEPGKPWRAAARELLGLSRFKTGDLKAASGYFEQLVLDPETPEPMRQRAQIMIGLVRGGSVPVQ